MKKILIATIIIFSLIFLVSCRSEEKVYDQEDTLIVNVENKDVKIMQLTDVHLTYGFDYLDKKTYRLIDKLVKHENPDVIVVTGDIMMSVFAVRLLKQFIKKMDSYNIPWTVSFGNHEMEYHKMSTIVDVLLNAKTNNLYFSTGPKLSSDNKHGFSNFKLRLMYENEEVLNLYILDSKGNRKDNVEGENQYDYFSLEQVNWYTNSVASDLAKSVVYMHMPLVQVELYNGSELNEKMWPQGLDTGFYEAMVLSNKSLGAFFGHDHLNSFSFTTVDNIILGYGTTTGYNAYGTNAKGAKIVNYNYSTQSITTYNITDKELEK